MKLRILYSFPHALGRPGIGTTAMRQIEGLIERGHDVDVVCASVDRRIGGARRIVQTLAIAGQRVPHRALGVWRAYRFHDRRTAGVLARVADVDVVHVWPAGCLRTLAVARRRGVPSFREVPSAHTQTAYEDAARAAEEVGVPLPVGHHHRHDDSHLARELREFAAADFLLVPSEYVEQTFLARGHTARRLLRHQYGFDPAVFRPVAAPTPRPGGLTAVFVGRGEPNKGLHHALRAWIRSGAGAGGTFRICGAILPEYRAHLRELLAHPSVEELGFVRDPGDVMRAADVLVLPSVSEGSALVTYEAQACGCALLVSDAAGAPCADGVEGLVHRAGDVDQLTNHFRRLTEDRALLERLRRGAVENARMLTWSAAAARMEAAYELGRQRYAAGGDSKHTSAPVLVVAGRGTQ